MYVRPVRRAMNWMAAIMLAAVAGVVATATPALADSGWQCRNIGNGDLCFRTFKLNASHIRGADIYYHKFGGTGCTRVRFMHMVVPNHGDYLYPAQVWSDDGYFQICGYELKSYSWTHAGGGAYVFPNGPVVGEIEEYYSGYDIFSPPVYRWNM